jgi:hypothetical protein
MIIASGSQVSSVILNSSDQASQILPDLDPDSTHSKAPTQVSMRSAVLGAVADQHPIRESIAVSVSEISSSHSDASSCMSSSELDDILSESESEQAEQGVNSKVTIVEATATNTTLSEDGVSAVIIAEATTSSIKIISEATTSSIEIIAEAALSNDLISSMTATAADGLIFEYPQTPSNANASSREAVETVTANETREQSSRVSSDSDDGFMDSVPVFAPDNVAEDLEQSASDCPPTNTEPPSQAQHHQEDTLLDVSNPHCV